MSFLTEGFFREEGIGGSGAHKVKKAASNDGCLQHPSFSKHINSTVRLHDSSPIKAGRRYIGDIPAAARIYVRIVEDQRIRFGLVEFNKYGIGLTVIELHREHTVAGAPARISARRGVVPNGVTAV